MFVRLHGIVKNMVSKMAEKNTKTPKSPRYSLPWAIDRILILLEKEGVHSVAPDIMAQHLGYSNARNGQAATVLATLRMYGMILKAPQRKDMVSEDIKKFKYTPYPEEKQQLADKWLRSPKLFASILSKYPDELPSEPALIYELIQDYNFTEVAAKKFIKVLKESIEYSRSFSTDPKPTPNENDDNPDTDIEDSTLDSIEQDSKQTKVIEVDLPVSEKNFSVQITGPGMNSVIEIKEEEDLMIVEAMLRKVSKRIFSE